MSGWSLALQPYEFTVEHRTDMVNMNADALSSDFIAREGKWSVTAQSC